MLTGATAYGNISATEQITSSGGSVDTHGGGFSFNQNLGNGTGAANAQKVADKLITTNTSGTTIDLTAFAGGINNTNVNLSNVKWLMISNQDPASSNVCRITFNGSNGNTNILNGTHDLQGGAALIFLNPSDGGFTVDSTHKNITLTALAGTPPVRITAVGEGS